MKEHIYARQEYARLVRAGKLGEAQKIIESIWNRDKSRKINETKPISKKVETIKEQKISKKIKSKKISLDSLIKIKGIGKKTLEDIKIMFEDIDSLKNALKENKVGLRDDIVDKLKEELV